MTGAETYIRADSGGPRSHWYSSFGLLTSYIEVSALFSPFLVSSGSVSLGCLRSTVLAMTLIKLDL